MPKRWILNFLKFLLVAGVFIYLYLAGKLDVAKLTKVFDSPGLFISALFLMLLGTMITVERWRLLLKIQNIFISYWRATQLTFIGLFFSTVIPGAVSGDLAKAYYLVRGQIQKTAPVMSIFFDRLLGLYTLILIAVFTMLFGFIKEIAAAQSGLMSQPYAKPLVIFVLGFFGGLTVLATVFMNKRISGMWMEKLIAKIPLSATIDKIYHAVHQHGSNSGLTFKALIMRLFRKRQVTSVYGVWPVFSALRHWCSATS